jgi:hypothetical protein
LPRVRSHREAGRRRPARGDCIGARLHHGIDRLRLQPVPRTPVAASIAPRRGVASFTSR